MPQISGISRQSFGDGAVVTLTGTDFGAARGTVQIGGTDQTILSWQDTSVTFSAVRGTQNLGPATLSVSKGTAQAPVSAVFEASGWGQEVTAGGTITGPAPLAVFFSAVGTSAPGYDAFREAGYHFDFGYATPSTPGSWQFSGKPKGNQVGGPVAAHVYETPGTYTASVRAQAPNGAFQDKTVTIVVQDPDTYWTTGGRSTVTISATTGAWDTWASNTRYRLLAGLDYTARGIVNVTNVQNVCLEKSGTGANPIVAALRFNYTTGSTPPTGARVIFNQIHSAGEMNPKVNGEDCLFYKCRGKDIDVGTLLLTGYNKNPSAIWNRPQRTFYWQCLIVGENVGMPFVSNAYQFVFAGCESVSPIEHALRVQGAQFAFIAHNYLHDYGGANPKHGMTLRGEGLGNLALSANQVTQPASRYIVGADNLIGDGAETGSSWPLYIGPEASTAVQSLEYIIAERTTFTHIPAQWEGYPVFEAVRGCRQITVRDSVYLQPGITGGTTDYNANYGVNPPEWSNGPLYSNTFINNPPDNVDAFLTPTGVLPEKAAVLSASFEVSGWGQEVTAGGTITGPAPLAVFFDAAETSASGYDAFREAGYHFDFGYATPTTPGLWAHSGKPKGNQVGGPVASHVYETPGTYTASVRAQLPTGQYHDRFVTVVVQDPNVVYAGAATVCVSLAGDFTGAPAGATTTSTVPATFSANTRYLFRAGETYSAVKSSFAHGTSSVYVDSFGSGARPAIKQAFPARPFTNSSTQLTGVVIANCSLDVITVDFGDYITIHKCDNWGYPDTGSGSFNSNTTVTYYGAVPPANTAVQNSRFSKNIVLSECLITTAPTGNYGAYFMGTRQTAIGNTFVPGGLITTHTMRIPFLYKGLVAHNSLHPTVIDRTYIKLHAKGTYTFSYDYAVSPSPHSRFVVIADNACAAGNCQQWMAVAPQNAQTTEIVQDVIVERNRYPSLGTTTPQSAVVLTGNRLTERNSEISNWPSGMDGRYVGIDNHTDGVGGLSSSLTGPFYITAGQSAIDGVKTFAAPASVLPNKAGT